MSTLHDCPPQVRTQHGRVIAWLVVLGFLAAVIVLPLAGAMLAGRPLAPFFRFPPPLEILAGYPRWSWIACALVLLPFGAIAWSWLRYLRDRERRRFDGRETCRVERDVPASSSPRPDSPARTFPAWGWLAITWTVLWWVLAWTRLEWFAPLQRYTFFPLWLGFIVSVNALTFRASGTCGMLRNPRGWLWLFATSAVFWWLFEWLNRFVRNWHYLAAEGFGPTSYALHATVCFSTVLPAVAAVAEYLQTRASLQRRVANGPAWPWFGRLATGVAFIFGGLAALALTGLRPLEAYPALWSAPLALAMGGGILLRRDGVWTEVALGDWSRAAIWALAALVCGFFWELWNVFSLAKWIYTVPFVDVAHVFEMPLLGYLGYLPFGIECLVVVDALAPNRAASGSRP